MVGGGGRSEHWVGYPTLGGVGVNIGYPTLPYRVLVGCSSYEMSNFLINRYCPRQQIIVQGQPTIAIREIPAVLLGVSLDRVGSI